jgi:hypothetical protein
VIRTRGPRADEHVRIVFGSCRFPKVAEHERARRLGIDALDAYATRMIRRPEQDWPDALLLLGDQVYADELTPPTHRRIAGRRPGDSGWPADEVVGYDEYVGLYQDSWSDPEVRWLMSTVPTAMIFDDHDVRDDWNISAAWRAQMAEQAWWPDRIRSALVSYWVYQHLGNLPPDESAADPDLAAVLAHDGDTWPLLRELADRADAAADGGKGVRFSFRWDLGRTRLLMIDSRSGRQVHDNVHLMVADADAEWIEQQLAAPGRIDHLLLGTSVPWLLPHLIAALETVAEMAAGRPGWRGRLGERLRQKYDLEHWPGFRASFDLLTAMIERATSTGSPTVTVLSGDVHHSYAARAVLPSRPAATVHELVCSPVHNTLKWYFKPVLRLSWSRALHAAGAGMARLLGAPPFPIRWDRVAGPLFGNTIATLDLAGPRVTASFEQPVTAATLVERARIELAG